MWLILLSARFSRLIRVVTCISPSFLYTIVVFCGGLPAAFCSSVLLSVAIWVISLLGYQKWCCCKHLYSELLGGHMFSILLGIPWHGIAESCDNLGGFLLFCFLEELPKIFRSSCSNLNSHQQCMHLSYPTSFTTLAVAYFTGTTLVSMRAVSWFRCAFP